MVYGELGVYPMSLYIKLRMINFWVKIQENQEYKLSSILYIALYKKLAGNMNYNFLWMKFIYNVLNDCGYSQYWLNVDVSAKCVYTFIKQRLCDQFLQHWYSDINTSPKALCYRLFKEDFAFEKYLEILNNKNRTTLCRFRTGNHKLPIETGRWSHIERNNRLCQICNTRKLGDEYHYVLECPVFNNVRKLYLKKYYIQNVNVIKLKSLFQSRNLKILKNLCLLINSINDRICSPTAPNL